MKFLYADWLLVCDESFEIIQNGAIVFDEKIIDVADIADLIQKYPNQEFEYLGLNSVLMPGFINPHIHLEFSANKTTLKYGNFNEWLNSVIQNREVLVEKANSELIDKTLENILKSGTTTIGAISSYGFELESCVKSPLNVVYFNEVLGSKADMIDTLFSDFKARVENSKKKKSKSFIPAIAIHSPYSTHPFLIREVLKIAKQENFCVSAHFMESKAERDWLEKNDGEFKPFFENFLNQNKAITTPKEFLALFKDIKKLSFTHCVEADEKELQIINHLKASIIHCPRSNRLLTNKTINIKKIGDINFSIATDGLSSNSSLNIFDELRAAFYIHSGIKTDLLANILVRASTFGGAKALGLDKGALKEGMDSDIISFKLPDCIEDESQLTTHIILHANKIDHTYIGGKKC